jgi:hypothetical protein
MWRPIFGNLKMLLPNEWCVENGFQTILCFLQHTPVLEKLIFQLCEVHVFTCLTIYFVVKVSMPN